MEGDKSELEIYAGIIKKRKWTILVTLFACIALSVVLIFMTKPVYRGEISFEIGTKPEGLVVHPASIVYLIQADPFKEKIREALSIPKKTEINITAKYIDTVVLVYATSESAGDIIRLLNAVFDFASKTNNDLYEEQTGLLKNEIAGLQEQIKLAQNKGKDYFILSSYFQSQINNLQKQLVLFKKTAVIFPPKVYDRPIKPRPVFNLAVGVILGVFLGIFLAFIQEGLSGKYGK